MIEEIQDQNAADWHSLISLGRFRCDEKFSSSYLCGVLNIYLKFLSIDRFYAARPPCKGCLLKCLSCMTGKLSRHITLFWTIMKKHLYIYVLLLLASCATVEKSSQPLRVLELEGTAYNRGFMHGEALKEEIKQIISQWINFTEMKHQLKIEEMKKDFLQSTTYLQSIKKWTPELLNEIQGIADGAGIDFEMMYLLQISEEFENYIPKYNLYSIAFKCTSIAVDQTDTSPTIIAQNMEPPHFFQGFPTLLHIKHDNNDLESYIFTFPGFIGLNGLNNKAVGVVVNGLPDYYPRNHGLPVSFIVRGILEKTTLNDAKDFIYNIEHAKAQNYIVGSREDAICFECDSENIYIFEPKDHHKITYHTNHYLVADYESKYCSRLATLKEELENRNFNIDFEDIVTILSSGRYNAGRPICHYNTYGCTVMSLTEEPELHISPGRPDKNQFLLFTFNK